MAITPEQAKSKEEQRRSDLVALSESVDAVFCISLKSRGDRRAEFQRAMSEIGLVDRVQFLLEDPFSETAGQIRGAAIQARDKVRASDLGCASAHRRAAELACRRGYENILVFEDDAVPVSTFDAGRIARGVKELESVKGDVLTLGCCNPDWRPGTPRMILGDMVEGHSEIVHVRNAVTTHAIIYNKRAFERLLLWLPDKQGMAQNFGNCVTMGAYDQWLFDCGGCYAMLHEQFVQSGSSSDILGMAHQNDIRKMIVATHEQMRENSLQGGLAS